MKRRVVLLIAAMAAALLLASGTALALNKVCQSDPCNGTTKADLLIGTDSGQTINGDKGNDHIIGDGGNDTLDGGPGSDTYSYTTIGTNFNNTPVEFGVDQLNDEGPAKDIDTLDFSKATNGGSGFTIHAGTRTNKAHDNPFPGSNKVVNFGSTTTIEKIVGSPERDDMVGGSQTNIYVLSGGGGTTGSAEVAQDDGGNANPTPSNDTYTGYKSGHVIVADFGGSGDVLDLRPYKATDVYFRRNSESLFLIFGPSSNDWISIANYFVPQFRIEKILFADRTITPIALQ